MWIKNKNEISLKNKLEFLEHRNKREGARKIEECLNIHLSRCIHWDYHLTETMHMDTFGI